MSLDIILHWGKGRGRKSDSRNITHNAGKIAQHVILHDIQGEGAITLYDVLWNHADKKRKAGELIDDLMNGLRIMSDNANRLKRYETTIKREPEMINGKMELRKLPPEKWYKWGSLEETDKYGRSAKGCVLCSFFLWVMTSCATTAIRSPSTKPITPL